MFKYFQISVKLFRNIEIPLGHYGSPVICALVMTFKNALFIFKRLFTSEKIIRDLLNGD